LDRVRYLGFVASPFGNLLLGSALDSSVCSPNSPLDPTARFNTTIGCAVDAATILGSSVCLAKPCWKALWLMHYASSAAFIEGGDVKFEES
jgi:hypothetical protein